MVFDSRLYRSIRVVGAAALCLAAACSEDAAPATDSGPGNQDSKVSKQDGKTPKLDGKQGDGAGNKDQKPDGPAKPARWDEIKSAGPAAWSSSATLLKDGRVLIAGGFVKNPGVVGINNCWFYRPVANVFEAAPPLKEVRGGHRAVLLTDGRVLVVGGGSSNYGLLSSVEIFNPQTNAWTKGQDMTAKRSTFEMVLLKNNNVLVAGGVTSYDPVDSMTIYDTQSGTWTLPAAKMKAKRSAFSATVLSNGKVILIGGYEGNSVWLSSIEIYDPVVGSMTLSAGKLGTARAGHTANLLPNGQILVVGGYCGSSCNLTGDELYNPATDSVTSINGPASYAHESATLKDGRVITMGGSKPTETKTMIYSQAGGGTWTTGPSLKNGRYNHNATTLQDGSVLVSGGMSGYPGNYTDPLVTTAERFFP